MNCTDKITHFDRFIKNELPRDEKEAYKAHIKHCSECQQGVIEHANYIETMSRFNAPEISQDKLDRLYANARSNENTKKIPLSSKQPQHFLTGFLAASVLFIGLVTTWQLTNNSPEQAPIAQITEEYFSTEVTLTINVPEDMNDADLNLILPDNVALQGFEGESELNWYVDLKKGPNTLSLPIEVEAGSDLNKALSFIAEIEYNNKQKDFELEVNLLAPKNQA